MPPSILAIQGETVSGDGWGARVEGTRVAVMVADGLGHGPEAAAASDIALKAFSSAAVDMSPGKILERAHASMGGTRGAVVAVASVDATAGIIRFAGLGNISGRVIPGVADKTLMTQNGTVGRQIRAPIDRDHKWPDHALVILHSDGLTSRWSLTGTPGLLQCAPAVIAGLLLREHSRGRDDATVVVLKRAR